MAKRRQVSFTRMEEGTPEDSALVRINYELMQPQLADKVLGLLGALKDSYMGYQITRYEHSLQAATLAYEDGSDEELVVAALLHDIGDNIAPENHSAVAAEILRPYVSDKTYWIVSHHRLFQGYHYFHHFGQDKNVRDMFRDPPYYQSCVDFCAKYDQCAFDPDFISRPLDFFEPMARHLFTGEPFSASKMVQEGGTIPRV